MTTRKYVLCHITYASLLIISLISFFSSLSIKEDSLIKKILLIISLVSFVLAILIIVFNIKKFQEYDTNKISSDIENIEYKTINTSISFNECFNGLFLNGYNRLTKELFVKKSTVSPEEFDTNENHIKLIRIDNIINIEECLQDYSKNNNNIALIFIENNINENLDILKEYIKETMIDVEVHIYGYKVFFAPIIITKDKIYYIKDGSIISIYRESVSVGIDFINKVIKNNK